MQHTSYTEDTKNITEYETERLLYPEGQGIFCEILSLINSREALPVITVTLWLPKQDLNRNTTNKQANVEEKYQEVSRQMTTDN